MIRRGGDKGEGRRKSRGVRSRAEAGVVSKHFVYFITALTTAYKKLFFPDQFRKQLKAKKAE